MRENNVTVTRNRVGKLLLAFLLYICVLAGCSGNGDKSPENGETVTASPLVSEAPAPEKTPAVTEKPVVTEAPTPTPEPFDISKEYETFVREDIYRIPVNELSDKWAIIDSKFAGDYAAFWLVPMENSEEQGVKNIILLIKPGIGTEQYRITPKFDIGSIRLFNDGSVILQEMETLRLHLYDNTLNEIKVIEQGEEDALLPIGFTEDKTVWVLDEENSRLLTKDMEGQQTGEFYYDADHVVSQYLGRLGEHECFISYLNDESYEKFYMYLSTTDGKVIYRPVNDPELGEESGNSWLINDSKMEIVYSGSTWFFHMPGYSREGIAFPKNVPQEGLEFLQGEKLLSSTFEWLDSNKYKNDYRLYDIEKRTVSEVLSDSELPESAYLAPKGVVGEDNVLMIFTYEDGTEDLLLWKIGEKTSPIEGFCDFTEDDPAERLTEILGDLKEKHGIVITPDWTVEGGTPENLGDIMLEMDFVNTFMLTAQTNPEAVTSNSGDTIHPENMRNNDGAEYSFNPHVFSSYYLKEHGEDRRDVFFRYVDALRAGEDRFKCPNIGAANWSSGRLAKYFFPIGSLYAYAQYSGDGWAEIVYRIPKEEFLEKERDFEERICAILNDVVEEDYTDFEKALALYEFMTEYCTYDYEMLEHNRNLDEEWINRQSGYRVLVEKQGICWEIACLYRYLLLQCGVDCEESTGEPVEFGEDLHEWNYIELDGQGYLIDATWGITDNREPDLAYFLFTDELRENRDGYKSESFDIAGNGLYGARQKYSFDADDERYSELWNGKYIAFDQDEKCIFYRDINGAIKRFDYA